ncbi:uncharacterized protein B0H18DRAFT_952757 [Fomitopsis serialis]|uniref:uncharacterized protein n=1 Tax=Fomitopsis serialis TaxID=139415 RepID=UPI0020077575|nr:uncharacterized protein B0H18DRAFT_952757 [Neoantrodia serialis]KAH9931230.1 hypothetical protein B0H18DRAFT_952757 [Neoantrodia serialis]
MRRPPMSNDLHMYALNTKKSAALPAGGSASGADIIPKQAREDASPLAGILRGAALLSHWITFSSSVPVTRHCFPEYPAWSSPDAWTLFPLPSPRRSQGPRMGCSWQIRPSYASCAAARSCQVCPTPASCPPRPFARDNELDLAAVHGLSTPVNARNWDRQCRGCFACRDLGPLVNGGRRERFNLSLTRYSHRSYLTQHAGGVFSAHEPRPSTGGKVCAHTADSIHTHFEVDHWQSQPGAGGRQVRRMDLTRTVDDICNYSTASCPENVPGPHTHRTTFPAKALDDAKPIEQAGLVDAIVISSARFFAQNPPYAAHINFSGTTERCRKTRC